MQNIDCLLQKVVFDRKVRSHSLDFVMKYPLQFDGILVIVVPVEVEKVALEVLSMVGCTALLELIARCVKIR